MWINNKITCKKVSILNVKRKSLRMLQINLGFWNAAAVRYFPPTKITHLLNSNTVVFKFYYSFSYTYISKFQDKRNLRIGGDVLITITGIIRYSKALKTTKMSLAKLLLDSARKIPPNRTKPTWRHQRESCPKTVIAFFLCLCWAFS